MKLDLGDTGFLVFTTFWLSVILVLIIYGAMVFSSWVIIGVIPWIAFVLMIIGAWREYHKRR